MSRAYSTFTIICRVRRQENNPLNKTRKFEILKQLVISKLSQTINNITKIKMEIITPVVTEDIVAYLFQNVNQHNKFFNIYKLIMNEANLVTA